MDKSCLKYEPRIEKRQEDKALKITPFIYTSSINIFSYYLSQFFFSGHMHQFTTITSRQIIDPNLSMVEEPQEY
jgi:hypothetical protein